MKHLKLFFALFAMLALGVGNAWGAEASFTIKFRDNGSDASTALTATTFTNQVAEGADLIKSVSTSYCYPGTGGLKCSSNNNNGTFTLTLNNSYTISKIVLNVKNKNATTKTVKVGNTSFSTSDSWSTTSFQDLAFTGTETTSDKITVSLAGSAKSKRVAYIASMTVYYKTDESGSGETVPSLTLDPTSKDFATVMVGEEASQEFTITPKNTTATLSASISDEINYAISGIENNKITVTYKPQSAKDKHDAVLTVKAGEEATATVNLTGKAVQTLEGTWILVTDASSLKAGDEIIIASKDENYALSKTQNDNNRGQVEITKTDNTITATTEAQVLTLQTGTKEGSLALSTGDGYLFAASSTNNYLRTETTLSDNSSWKVTIAADDAATLTAQGTNSRNTIFYNQSSKIFACYASTTTNQKAIAIYKNTNGQQLAGLAYATTKYLTKLGDAFTTPTLTNPNSLTVTYSSSDNNVATVAADGVVTIKAAGVVKITASFEETESYLGGSASYTIGVTEHAGTQADPYSVADARRVIDVMGTAEGVYATGIVSEIVTAYNEQYGNITYNISVNGTTTADQLQAYRGKGVNGVNFTSADDVKVGDEVVVKGNLKLHNGTVYELDADNQLVTLKRDKQQAGLAYEEKEHTANVGEDFTEPALSNPNSLTVTYSSSNTALATVDATTGEVSILAAGKVTITASSAADATYAAGHASYNITITDPSLAVATLPFYFNGKQADIEGTPGMTQSGIDSKDYADAPYLKMNTIGDWLIIRFDSEPGKLSYDIKNNSFSGGTFSVQESADGETYTDVKVHTEITETQSEEHTLLSTSRYVKFIYTEKVTGNVGLGSIKITKFGEEPEQPGEGGGETPEERLTDWVLTPLADITTNDLVVITMTKGETTWAMSNDNSTSAAPAAPVVTLSADALAAEPDANLKWVVSNDNGTLTIYPYGTYETYLYCTNTNNGVRVGTGEAKEFTIDTDHLYTTLTKDPRYLGVYDADADTWRCYTSINSNIEGQTLAFYVKKNANDVLPGTGEDPEEPGDDPVVPTPTINPTATFIFNTAEGLNDLGITYPVTPTTVEDGTEDAFKTEFENNAKFTQDGITMTTTGGTVVATRVWLTAAGKLDLRVYKGATLTFSVPAEHKISAIVFDGSNIGHLLVNGNAVSGNAWTGSAQTITFTAKDDAKTIKINTIAFVVEYTRDVTKKYGTICLPYASASTSGAYFYRVAGQETGKVYLESVDALEAGVPYIFEKTANTIKVVYSSEKEDTPQKVNGLIGNFTNEYVVPANNYILYNNAFIPADGTTNKVNAYRAYLDLSAVTDGAPQQMPGRRYIGMDVQGENVETGVEDLFTTDAPVKVIENGQLIIIRDGVKYNVQGQKL